MIKCEICNKNFPKTQINDHIQIELQDPRYMEIRQEMLNLEKSSAMPQGDMIAKHLNQLKKKRPDIFSQDQLPPLVTHSLTHSFIALPAPTSAAQEVTPDIINNYHGIEKGILHRHPHQPPPPCLSLPPQLHRR